METQSVEAGRERPLALAILVREHDEIARAFECLEKAEGADRAQMRASLLEAVDRHLALEESVFYPALDRGEGLDTMRRRSEQEHDELRNALRSLRGDGDPDTGAIQLARLVFERHRRGEEEEVFPLVERTLDEALPELAIELEQQREAENGAYGVG